jgi:hypothetical protein
MVDSQFSLRRGLRAPGRPFGLLIQRKFSGILFSGIPHVLGMQLRMDVVVSRDAAEGEGGCVCSTVSLNLLINSGLLLRRRLVAVRCARDQAEATQKVEVNDQGSIPSCSLYVT